MQGWREVVLRREFLQVRNEHDAVGVPGVYGLGEIRDDAPGISTPPKFLDGKKADKDVINMQRCAAPLAMLANSRNRCVMPFKSFRESAPVTSRPIWSG